MKLSLATRLSLLTSLSLLTASPPVLAGPPHQHGVAQLDIAVDRARVSLTLDIPLDSLLGFERGPRSDAERAKVDAALMALRDAAALFRIDGAADCTPGRVTLSSPPLGLGAVAATDKEGHADLEAQYEFDCKAAARPGFVEVGLFAAFPALQRIELQVATGRGQLKATLKKPATRVALPR